jgi:hypothetical protein
VREAEDLGQRPLLHARVLGVGARADDADDGVLGRDLGVARTQRRAVGDHQLEGESVVVLEPQAGL